MTPSPQEKQHSLPHPSWLDTARHLISLDQLRDSSRLVAHPSLWISTVAGLQVALSVLLIVTVVYFSPRSHLVGFAALGGLTALFGRFAPVQERRRIVIICALLMTMAVLVPSLFALVGAQPWAMILLLALSVGVLTLLVSHLRLGVPGAVIIVFATGAGLAPVTESHVVVERTLATLSGGLSACFVCLCTDWLRRRTLAQVKFPAPVVYPLGKELVVAARITIGAGLAAFIAYGAGWSHPEWAAIGATAVMQGGHLHITMSRAVQRMVGTIAGAFLCGWILSTEPSFWWWWRGLRCFSFRPKC